MSQVQEKVIIVDNPRVIKILKKRFTKQILNCFIDAPKTAAEIASSVSFPKEKIYYHIKKLVSLNILYVSETKEVKGIIQKKFLPVAEEIKFGDESEVTEEKPIISDDPDKKTSYEKGDISEIKEQKTEKVKKADKIEKKVDEHVKTKTPASIEEESLQEDKTNILLENLKKSRSVKKITIDEEPTGQIKTDSSPIIEQEQTKKATFLRSISDRRRSNDRRDERERRVSEERREKQIIGYKGKERRKVMERRIMENRRISESRRTESDRRLDDDLTDIDPISVTPPPSIDKKRSGTMDNTLMHLNGMTHAMTFVHTGENVTFMQADKGLDDYVIKQVKNYKLPYENEGQIIDTLPELIKHVYQHSVDNSKKGRHYLAYTSIDYHYEMTYMQSQTQNKDEFKDFLYYNLNKSYALNMENTVVDWTANDSYENNTVVCYSSSKDKIEQDYDILQASGIQPRYNTSIPKILLNIYNNSVSGNIGGNALMVYMVESKTFLALIQRFQLVDSRYFRIGMDNFILPLCKTFDVNGSSSQITEDMALDFLRTHGIAVDDNVHEDTGPVDWRNAQDRLQAPVEMLKKELVNSNSYFTNVRRKIAKKSILIDAVYVGGPGSQIKNITQVIRDGLDRPTHTLDELYTGHTKMITIPKKEKRLARNKRKLIKQRNKTKKELSMTKARVKELRKELNAFQDPGAMEIEIERLALEKIEKTKKLDIVQATLGTTKEKLVMVKDKFKEERSGLIDELGAMADKIDQLEKENMDNHKELDLIINNVSGLKESQSVNSIEKFSRLRSKIREIEEEQQLIIKEANDVKVECELCDGKIRNHEKAIELTVRDALETSTELKVKKGQRDEYKKNPWRSPVTTISLKQAMEDENVELAKRKKELEINISSKQAWYRDGKKRRKGLKGAITPLQKDLDRAHSDRDEMASVMVEISYSFDQNQKKLDYTKSEFDNSMKVHNASIESIDNKIGILELKNVGEREDGSRRTLDELNEQRADCMLKMAQLEEKFKLEMDQESIKHDQMKKMRTDIVITIEKDRKKILQHKKVMDQCLMAMEHCQDVSNILNHLQRSLQVTTDMLQESFSHDLLKIDSKDNSVVGSLSTAEQTLVWSKGRLPEYRKKLAKRIENGRSTKKRSSDQEQKENTNIEKIIDAMDELIAVPDHLKRLRERLSKYQYLINDKNDLLSKQDKLLAALDNIDQVHLELEQKHNDAIRMAKKISDILQKNIIRRDRERSALEIKDKGVEEITDAIASLRKTHLEDIDATQIIIQDREKTIDELKIRLAGLVDVKNKLVKYQLDQRKTEKESQDIERSIQTKHKRIKDLEDRFQEKKDNTSRKIAELTVSAEQLTERIRVLEKKISDEDLWVDQANDRNTNIKKQKQQWIQEKSSLKAESDTLDTQTSVHRADLDEYKVNLQVGLEKSIERSKMDESTVVDKAEKEIHSYREALLKRLQFLTDQEDTIRKKMNDETELLDSLNLSHENISRTLKADQKKNKPIITKFSVELKSLEDKLSKTQKNIHVLRRELKRQQRVEDRWKKRLSNETITVAERVADLNDSIKNKRSATYLSFVLESLERMGDQTGSDIVAEDIIEENIQSDQENIRSAKAGLRDLKVRSKGRLNELSAIIKKLKKDLGPITRERNGLLRNIRITKRRIEKVEKPIRHLENKVEQSSGAIHDAEVKFLKFQKESENELSELALTRGETQDSSTAAIDRSRDGLKQTISNFRAQRKKIKDDHDAELRDHENEVAATLDSIIKRQKAIQTALSSGEKAQEEDKVEIKAMVARKKTAMEMKKTNQQMIRVHQRDIKNIERIILTEDKAISNAENKFFSELKAVEKTITGLKEEHQAGAKDTMIRAARMSEIKKQNPGYDQNLRNLEKEIAALKKKNKTLKGQQNKAKDRFTVYKVRLSDQLTVLEQKQKHHKSILGTLIKDISDLENDLDRSEKAQESHEHRLQVLDHEKVSVQDKLRSIVRSIEHIRKQANVAKTDVEICLKVFERSKKIREGIITVIDSVMDSTGVRISQLDKDQKDVQGGLKDLEKCQKERRASLRSLEQDLGALNRKMQNIEKTYFISERSLQQKLAAGEIALNSVKTELAILEQEKRTTISELKTLQDQKRAGINAIEKNEKLFSTHFSALKVTRDTLAEEKTQTQIGLDLITASITDINTRMDPLLAQSDELQKAQGRLEIEINSQIAEVQGVSVKIQDNINGIEKTDRVIHKEQKRLRREEQDLNVSVRDLEIRLEAANKYVREQQGQLEIVNKNKDHLKQLLFDKEKKLLEIEKALDTTMRSIKDRKKLKKFIKTEQTLTTNISRAEKDLDHLQENYRALNRVLTDRDQSANENVKELETNSSESELSIINIRKEIRDIERKVRSLSKTLRSGPERIKTIEKKLKRYCDDKDQLELKLKEIQRGLDLIRKKIDLMLDGSTQEITPKGKQVDIDYMANMGLLLDSRAGLNILPDAHKADFKYFVPNRVLQGAMLVVITFFTLLTFSRRSSLAPLENSLPQKTEQAAALDIKKQVYSDILYDLGILEGFHALLAGDKVMSDNIVSVLKYVSNSVPSEFKVTDLVVNNKVPYHRLDKLIADKLETEKKPLLSITLDGFLQMDGDRSAQVLRPFRSQLERDKQFKVVLFSEQDDGSRYKTPYIIDLIL